MTGTTVLFDLFGVIARHQSPEGKDRLVRTAGVPAAAFWPAYWAQRPPYDRGDVGGADYWHRVADALGTRFDEHRVTRLVEADIDSWSGTDDAMVALVEQLAVRGGRIGLLSNIPEELAVHYEARHDWLGLFAVRAFSCRIGRAKPEPDAYRWCLEALREEHADRVLFVDDRPENVRAAEAIGMRGHLFTGSEGLRARLAG
ncbi:HAD-IA family hydrolase [Streptomyces fructofermentans]|uniref:HAD-IA family hydrolase n=1 Tax=Streptomyces fructofermentans TaxID=152141 RepID=UPI0037BBBD03